MKAIARYRFGCALLLCGLGHIAAAETVGIDDGLSAARTHCGYDLTELKPVLIAANVESSSSSGMAITFRLRSKSQAQSIAAQLSINCSSSPINTEGQADVVPDARAVIQEEDAGGRYFRHVASQRLVQSRNWRANVAVVDYVEGDAQRVRSNDVLACNADALAPCISLQVDKPLRLSNKSMKLIYSMIERIAVVKSVDGNLSKAAPATANAASAPASR